MREASAGPRSTRRPLTGHSGASLTLIEAGGQTFVRKQARTADQSARLAAQCEKLRRAHEAGLPCPSVLASGTDGALFWFDMEYVPADSLAHTLISGREPDWRGLLPQIKMLPEMFSHTATGLIPADRFHAKLTSVAAACQKNAASAPAFARIAALVERLGSRDWAGVPESRCHGDFTLENILVRADGRATIIDFDVPEQSSWWLDIAKLFQDLAGHWCLRHFALSDPQGVDALNAQLALSRAAAHIAPVLTPMIPGGIARLRPFIAFHLLRTLPYAREPLMVSFVLRRIAAVLEDVETHPPALRPGEAGIAMPADKRIPPGGPL